MLAIGKYYNYQGYNYQLMNLNYSTCSEMNLPTPSQQWVELNPIMDGEEFSDFNFSFINIRCDGSSSHWQRGAQPERLPHEITLSKRLKVFHTWPSKASVSNITLTDAKCHRAKYCRLLHTRNRQKESENACSWQEKKLSCWLALL